MFHQDSALCLQQQFDEVKGVAHLVIKQVAVLPLLDHCPNGDTAQENYQTKQLARIKTFDNSAGAKDLARLGVSAQEAFAEAFQLR